MPPYRRTSGAPPLLFDRLADGAPPRLHDADALRASVARELADLFNTRTPLPIDVLERRPTRTAIDYGIPDFSAFPLGDSSAMARLAQNIRAAVLAYETRLHDPEIELRPDPRNLGSMIAVLRGVLHIEQRRMPVSFELPVGGSADGADGD